MYPFIMSSQSISIVIDGKNHIVPASHPNFDKIRDAIKANDEVAIPDLIDIPQAIRRYAEGKLEVFDDSIVYNGEMLANPLVDRILRMMAEGFDIAPMAKFLDDLLLNPSRTAVQELYLFLEANGIAITPDGHFLAYKRVRPDFRDIHSGQFDNSIGSIHEMPRNKVDEDRRRTCSYGFHVCSLTYLPNFSSQGSDDHVMIVKVNPADVVAVPEDYNNAKMRVAKYAVVDEYKGEWDRDAFTTAVVDEYEPEIVEEEHTYTVKLRALDDVGAVHEAYLTLAASDEESANEFAVDRAEEAQFAAGVDLETVKAVSATLVD